MSDSLTPMMRQYRKLKAGLPANTILFFRLGDFYEMFYEDAVEAARILDIALTKRQKVPMCGVPYHSHEGYLAKLIRSGKKVAVCDQVEDPAKAPGLVRREVTSILSPGAVFFDQVLTAHRNNYLAGLCQLGAGYGLALLDLSTGSFWGEEIRELDTLRDNLLGYAPAECVLAASLAEKLAAAPGGLLDANRAILINPHDDWAFEQELAHDLLLRHFGVQSLDGFGCEGHPAVIAAAGGLLHYVQQTLRRDLAHVRQLSIKHSDDYLVMDETTRVNLDLVSCRGAAGLAANPQTASSQRAGVSLLDVLDSTQTAMGGRLLREWVLRPLVHEAQIRQRHDALERFCADRACLHKLRELLGKVRDMERGLARLGGTSGNARDVRALAQSLAQLPAVRSTLEEQAFGLLAELAQALKPLPELVSLIERALVEEPPFSVKEGGIICRGYQAELDALRDAAALGKSWLAEYQAREQERSGIKTLKVRHNKVFGYYIEISKAQAANAPADYTRKQTLVNAERFITPDLKEYETKIFGAQDKAMALEYELFLEIRAAIIRETNNIQAAARALAQLDVLAALADRALTLRYVRPVISTGDVMRIRAGRHPVIEQIPGADRFVPNDLFLNGNDNRLMIITGPNMAGKSTYIRQLALIVIMAQLGSFVPAEAAEIGLVDRVFTRIGASDDLVRGRSTFMVEMQETANILNNATARSLVILDEIGRGTSTFDGISIAWAVAEFLHDVVKSKTLFATHYHELTDLARTLAGVKNYNVLVREQGERIVFLRKIAPGAADKSYGIQVARLAGLPHAIIERAREILLNLEEGEFGDAGQPKLAARRPRRSKPDSQQLSLFA